MSKYYVISIKITCPKDRVKFVLNDYQSSKGGKLLTDEIDDRIYNFFNLTGFVADLLPPYYFTEFDDRNVEVFLQFDYDKIVDKIDNTVTSIKQVLSEIIQSATTTVPGYPNPPLFEYTKNQSDSSINTFSSDQNGGGWALSLYLLSAESPIQSGTQSALAPENAQPQPVNGETTDTELDPQETPSSLPEDDPNESIADTPNQETPTPDSSTTSPPPEDVTQPEPQEQTPMEVDEQDQGREERTGETPNANKNKGEDIEKTKSIKNVFPNERKAKEIKIELPPNDSYKKEFAESFGNLPMLWYNGTQIEYADIISFELSYVDNLPTLTAKFKDTIGLMKQSGIPLDDTKISLFLNPRTKFLKPIHMDFKIVDFSDDNDIYGITGVIDIKELYLRKFQSYSQKTSYKLYEQIAKDLGLGFNSNIDNTDDKMTWINTGNKLYEFINGVTQHTYKSDETYLIQYIDFYYNLNYVDVEKEMKRDITKELGIANVGIEEVVKTLDQDVLSQNFLSNDFANKQTNFYYEKYTTINNATRISLTKGYLTKLKFYDELKKNFLVFDIDAITSPADEKILLRGAPQDETFFKENINLLYAGRLDMDNVHENYYYAVVQNKINYMELSKIGLIVELTSPNYNFYKFQKVFVIVSNQKASPSKSELNSRLTGQWLISDISFTFIGGNFRQRIELSKRDLELSPEELSKEAPQTSPTNQSKEPTQNQNNENPTDQEAPLPAQPAEVGPTSSTPPQPGTITPVTGTSTQDNIDPIPPAPPVAPAEEESILTKEIWRTIYLGKVNPKVIEKYYTPMVEILRNYNIKEDIQISNFLSFVNIESNYLNFVTEDVNWTKYAVVSNESLTTDLEYKGRGLSMIFGEDQYKLTGQFLGKDFLTNPTIITSDNATHLTGSDTDEQVINSILIAVFKWTKVFSSSFPLDRPDKNQKSKDYITEFNRLIDLFS
jgi:hypothetical protein